MRGLVLSLFPGIGLLDMAFEEAGFCVVRGPDLLWGGDIRKFSPPEGCFDGVIGDPPCPAYSKMRHLAKANGYKIAPDLIPEFLRVVGVCRPAWFLMENAKGSPVPEADGYKVRSSIVSDLDCGGVQMRERRISFGSLAALDFWLTVGAAGTLFPEKTICASGVFYRDVRGLPKHFRRTDTKVGACARTIRDSIRAQGLPGDFLIDAPFTVKGKQEVIGNGVPLPMGRAIAKAVKRALESQREVA